MSTCNLFHTNSSHSEISDKEMYSSLSSFTCQAATSEISFVTQAPSVLVYHTVDLQYALQNGLTSRKEVEVMTHFSHSQLLLFQQSQCNQLTHKCTIDHFQCQYELCERTEKSYHGSCIALVSLFSFGSLHHLISTILSFSTFALLLSSVPLDTFAPFPEKRAKPSLLLHLFTNIQYPFSSFFPTLNVHFPT